MGCMYSAIAFTIFVIVIPYLFGSVICHLCHLDKDISMIYVGGFIGMIALFQLVAVPMIKLQWSLSILTYTWMVAIVLLCGVGVCRYRKNGALFSPVKELKSKCPMQNKMVLILVFFMCSFITLQMFMYLVLEHIDLDDARFVANAVSAWDSDRMLLTHPNTGERLEQPIGELRKDAVSPWMLMIAMIAKISRIHPTVLAHTFLPPFLLLVLYFAIWQITKMFWKDDVENRSLFIIVTSFMHVFWCFSAYRQNTFFMVRIWQGKAIVAGLIIPVILYCMLKLDVTIQKRTFFFLFVVNMSACCLSGMGLIMSAFMEACFLLSLCVRKRNIRYLIYGGLSCAPNVIYGILYLGSKLVQA